MCESEHTLSLLPWLLKQIDKKIIPNLKFHKGNTDLIQIPWNKQGSCSEQEQLLHKLWVDRKGYDISSASKPSENKDKFRNALKRSNTLKERKDKHQLNKQTDNFRVYEVLTKEVTLANAEIRRQKRKNSKRTSSEASSSTQPSPASLVIYPVHSESTPSSQQGLEWLSPSADAEKTKMSDLDYELRMILDSIQSADASLLNQATIPTSVVADNMESVVSITTSSNTTSHLNDCPLDKLLLDSISPNSASLNSQTDMHITQGNIDSQTQHLDSPNCLLVSSDQFQGSNGEFSPSQFLVSPPASSESNRKDVFTSMVNQEKLHQNQLAPSKLSQDCIDGLDLDQLLSHGAHVGPNHSNNADVTVITMQQVEAGQCDEEDLPTITNAINMNGDQDLQNHHPHTVQVCEPMVPQEGLGTTQPMQPRTGLPESIDQHSILWNVLNIAGLSSLYESLSLYTITLHYGDEVVGHARLDLTTEKRFFYGDHEQQLQLLNNLQISVPDHFGKEPVNFSRYEGQDPKIQMTLDKMSEGILLRSDSDGNLLGTRKCGAAVFHYMQNDQNQSIKMQRGQETLLFSHQLFVEQILSSVKSSALMKKKRLFFGFQPHSRHSVGKVSITISPECVGEIASSMMGSESSSFVCSETSLDKLVDYMRNMKLQSST